MQKKAVEVNLFEVPKFPRCRVPSIRCHTQWRSHGLKHGRKQCGWRWGESTSNCVVLSVTWYQNSRPWALQCGAWFWWSSLVLLIDIYWMDTRMFWTSPIDLMDINSLSAVPCMLGMVSIPSAWFAVPWQTFSDGNYRLYCFEWQPILFCFVLLSFLDAFFLGLFCGPRLSETSKSLLRERRLVRLLPLARWQARQEEPTGTKHDHMTSLWVPGSMGNSMDFPSKAVKCCGIHSSMIYHTIHGTVIFTYILP